MPFNPQPAPQDPAELEAEVASVFMFDEAPPSSDAAPAPPEPTPSPPAPGAGEPAAVAPGGTPPAPVPPPPPAPAPATPPPPGLEAPAVAPGAPPAPPPPAAAPAVDEKALKQASLEAQVQALTAENERLRTQPPAPGSQPAPGTPAAQPGTDGQPEEVRYALSIPDPLFEAIMSEDAAQNRLGMTTLINSLATNIHTNLRNEFNTRLTAMQSRQEQDRAQQDQGAALATAREQYFQRFPTHNDPILQPIISQQAQQLAVEFPNLPWDDNYMNALGARVNAAITKLTGQASPAPPAPPPPPAPSPRPAAMLPVGAPRPAGVEPDAFNSEDVIASTFTW
jgi:hypothetical protein